MSVKLVCDRCGEEEEAGKAYANGWKGMVLPKDVPSTLRQVLYNAQPRDDDWAEICPECHPGAVYLDGYREGSTGLVRWLRAVWTFLVIITSVFPAYWFLRWVEGALTP